MTFVYRKGIPEVKFVNEVFRQLNALSGGGVVVGSEEYDFCLRERESRHRLEIGAKVHG